MQNDLLTQTLNPEAFEHLQRGRFNVNSGKRPPLISKAFAQFASALFFAFVIAGCSGGEPTTGPMGSSVDDPVSGPVNDPTNRRGYPARTGPAPYQAAPQTEPTYDPLVAASPIATVSAQQANAKNCGYAFEDETDESARAAFWKSVEGLWIDRDSPADPEPYAPNTIERVGFEADGKNTNYALIRYSYVASGAGAFQLKSRTFAKDQGESSIVLVRLGKPLKDASKAGLRFFEKSDSDGACHTMLIGLTNAGLEVSGSYMSYGGQEDAKFFLSIPPKMTVLKIWDETKDKQIKKAH